MCPETPSPDAQAVSLNYPPKRQAGVQPLQLTPNSPLPCGTLQMRCLTALPVDASGQAPSAGTASKWAWDRCGTRLRQPFLHLQTGKPGPALPVKLLPGRFKGCGSPQAPGMSFPMGGGIVPVKGKHCQSLPFPLSLSEPGLAVCEASLSLGPPQGPHWKATAASGMVTNSAGNLFP